MNTADAIMRTLESQDVRDVFNNSMANANVVDVINHLANSTSRVANAITPMVAGREDETGGHVESLTEAVMGMTSGLCLIASAIESLAEAVRDHESSM